MKKKSAPSTTHHIDAREKDYLYVSASQIAGSGKGLFTAIPIYKDEVISVFKGKILTDKEAKIRAGKNADRYFINMPDGTIMDSMSVKCFAKYANDAAGFIKTKFKNNSLITLDENETVCITAKRDILCGEEIFCSYGKAYWKKYLKHF